jgi:hypothetical protein
MSLILSGTDGLSDVDGSASTPALRGTDANTGIFFPAADTIAFAEGGTEVMRINSAGNVGIGTSTPSGSTLEVARSSGGDWIRLSRGTTGTSKGILAFGINNAGTYSTVASVSGGSDSGSTANSSLAFNVTDSGGSTTERMRIDSSGNVGIGTSSPSGFGTPNLHINGTTPLIHLTTPTTGTTSGDGTQIAVDGVNFQITNLEAGNLVFGTGSAERMRIDSIGRLLLGKTSSGLSVNGFEVEPAGNIIVTCASTDTAQFYRKTSAGGNGVILTYSDVGGTANLVGAGFANGTFGAVSDINKKKNVETARSYLDDVMKLRVVKYNWNTDEDDAPKELGWIAQEVEQVFSGMVTEIEGSKLLKKEVFLPMLMKAIQEQQAMIEELKAEVAALKAA